MILIRVAKSSGESIQTNASNLILLLQGNVYEGMACNSVKGKISTSALGEIQNAVRTRVFELTIALEKGFQRRQMLALGQLHARGNKDTEAVTHISQQIINGNVATIANTG